MLGGGLFDECVDIVRSWRPQKKYSRETQYRDELMKFLNKELNQSGGMLGGSRNIQLKKEASRSLCDIGVGDKQVGIELKRNLKSKSQINRLQGQIDDYMDDYKEGVIVVLVGKSKKYVDNEVRNKLRKKLDKGIGKIGQQFRIKLINKTHNKSKKTKRKSPFDISFGGI